MKITKCFPLIILFLFTVYSTKNRTSGIRTSGDRTSGGPPVVEVPSHFFY